MSPYSDEFVIVQVSCEGDCWYSGSTSNSSSSHPLLLSLLCGCIICLLLLTALDVILIIAARSLFWQNEK